MKHLVVNTPQYIKLEEGFKEWLSVLGYAEVSVISHPRVVHEFFYYLESQHIADIEQVDNDTVYAYFDYLKGRKKIRDNGTITNNYMNKHLQTIKRFTEYLRDAHGKSFTTDMIAFKSSTPPAIVLRVKKKRRCAA
jgi:integrase/recombinase XerD